MTAAPVHQETIPIRASAFEGFPVKAAIDRGCSLTKVIFLPKDARVSDSDLTLPMRCLTFLNTDFKDALRVMRDQAQLPPSGKLHVTGVGCDAHKEKIKEVVGLDIVFIQEVLTIGRGVYLLLKNSPAEDLFHQPPGRDETLKVEWDFFEKMKSAVDEERAKQDEDDDALFPAVVLSIGSGGARMFISKDGVSQFCGGTIMTGCPFLGLAKVLLGTNDYDEIMDLASRGIPANNDLLVKDLLKNDPHSHYGRFPREMPMFPFGKASEGGWQDGNCSKEDVALSLVSLFAAEIAFMMFSTMMERRVRRAYLAGNFFRSDVVRSIVYHRMQLFQGFNFDLRIMKTGHTGAVAAMLSKEEDVAKYLKL